MPRVLVIDDEEDTRRVLKSGLESAGFEVITAEGAADGLRAAFEFQPELAILDVMMPGMNGLELCQRLRELSDLPIIMLTALSTENDIVKGLTVGADDYLTKPFGMAELVARVKGALRRKGTRASTTSAVLSLNGITIDLARHRVTVRGEPVELSPTEFRLLAYLARHRDRVTPHETLLAEIWGPEYRDQLEYLRLYIRYLRQKIEADPGKPRIIKTEWGVGYYLDA